MAAKARTGCTIAHGKAMGRLTTHVLDTATGCPGAGVRIELYRLGEAGPARIAEARTNADGRLDAPLLEGAGYAGGTYEIVFHVGAYYAGLPDAKGGFLDLVPVRFTLDAGEDHTHVPLLISPYGYTTYRGS